MWKPVALLLCAVTLVTASVGSWAQPPGGRGGNGRGRPGAVEDGNFKVALELVTAQLRNPAVVPGDAEKLLRTAVESLQRLDRLFEIDALREELAQLHADKWEVQLALARSLSMHPSEGSIVSGEFRRGQYPQGGEYARFVTSAERDRVRQMQLLSAALAGAERNNAGAGPVVVLQDLARSVQRDRSGNSAWKLQSLTDLKTMPDFGEGNRWGRWGGGGGGDNDRGAPVTPEGTPLLYRVPDSFDAAANDGERWRWLLTEIARRDPAQQGAIQLEWAGFLRSQFGVETMQSLWGIWDSRPAAGDEALNEQSGPLTVRTLAEDEVLASLPPA